MNASTGSLPSCRTGRCMRRCVLFLAFVLRMAAAVRAQNTNDLNSGIQFDFSPSGARSEAMGGAAVALAEDATAVYANPAGLATFDRREFSVEARGWEWTSWIWNDGHAFGPPTGIGTDTISGLQAATFSKKDFGPSFVSFVSGVGNPGWLGGLGPRLRVGAYWRRTTDYQTDRTREGEYFQCSGGFRGAEFPDTAPFCETHAYPDSVDRIFPAIQHLSVRVSDIGGSTSFQLMGGPRTYPSLSLGVSVYASRFEIDGTNQVFTARWNTKYFPADYSPSNLELESTEKGSDTQVGVTAAVLWAPSVM